MAKPPPPPPPRPPKQKPAPEAPAEPQRKSEDQLAEVERAISLLGGRHPEAVRAEREDAAAKAARREELAREEARERRDKLRKRIMIGVVATCVLATIGMLVRYRAKSQAFDAGLEQLSASYTRLGFAVVASSTLRAPDRAEAQVDPGCVIALGPPGATLKAEHGTTVVRGRGSIAWCACAAETASVAFEGALPKDAGVRLVHGPGKLVGGSAGLRFVEPPIATVAPGNEECAAESFDEWIAEGRNPPTKVDPKWLEADASRKQLLAAGLAGIAGASPELPFAVVEPRAAQCYVATSTAAQDALSLRLPGGAKPIASSKGPIAWCDARELRFVVQREGLGELFVLSAASKAIGGMLGLRDALAKAGAPAAATWLRPEDVGSDAVDAMRAFGIPEPTLAHDGMQKGKDVANARVVSFSLVEAGSLSVDTPAETFWLCTPPVEQKPLQSLCVQSRAQIFRTNGASPAGIAMAPLPPWLGLHEGANDPAQVNSAHALLSLARALRRQGFEPSTLEGVTENARGAEILGRAGDAAIVAVTLLPQAPWAVPLSDSDPWTLQDAPRVVAIKPGDKVLLVSPSPLAGAPSSRRTVVFRRGDKR